MPLCHFLPALCFSHLAIGNWQSGIWLLAACFSATGFWQFFTFHFFIIHFSLFTYQYKKSHSLFTENGLLILISFVMTHTTLSSASKGEECLH
jgi:hypothetical protein